MKTAADQIEFLIHAGAHRKPHAHGRTLFEHLLGTRSLLAKWDASEEVRAAGLFHSVYGTDRYKVKLVADEERDTIRGLIGADAERLVFLFSNLRRPEAFIEADGVRDIDRNDFCALIEIECANVIDQTPLSACDRRVAENLSKGSARAEVFAAALRFCLPCRQEGGPCRRAACP